MPALKALPLAAARQRAGLAGIDPLRRGLGARRGQPRGAVSPVPRIGIDEGALLLADSPPVIGRHRFSRNTGNRCKFFLSCHRDSAEVPRIFNAAEGVHGGQAIRK
jgi:hypothetical protein